MTHPQSRSNAIDHVTLLHLAADPDRKMPTTTTWDDGVGRLQFHRESQVAGWMSSIFSINRTDQPTPILVKHGKTREEDKGRHRW
jgi:hypothetical protein